MINEYLILLGDSINNALTLFIILTSIFALTALIVTASYLKIFSEYSTPDEADERMGYKSFNWFIKSIIILLIIIFVKTLTPNTEEMITLNGLYNIKINKPYAELPITLKSLKSNFPDIYDKINCNTSYIVNTLNKNIQKQTKIIDSLKIELDSLKQFQLTTYK
jgi:hypothetical protein